MPYLDTPPNRDLITANGDAVIGDPTQNGEFVGQFNVDAGQRGAFGIGTATPGTNTARLAVVDDNANDIICDRSEPLTGRLISLSST